MKDAVEFFAVAGDNSELERHLRRAIDLARKARERGNHPFGALLVDGNGTVLLEAENTIRSDRDVTAHAETNLVRMATHQFPKDFLADCTVYTSTEPCVMCTGASMPFAPSSDMPSGRSRNMKCCNAGSPKATSIRFTPAG